MPPRHMRRWGLLVLVGFGVFGLRSAPALAASAPRAAEPAPQVASFFDGFDTSTLEGGWGWVREDNTAWSLTERAGFLRIHTQEGTLDDASTANNILRRAAPTTDYEVATRVEVTVAQDFHEAGLLLYTGDSNFIKISRIYDFEHGGSVFLLRREVGGTGVGSFFSPEITGSVAEMRLRFVAGQVTGAYKDGNGAWVTLGSYAVGPVDTYPYVALAAHHGFPDTPPKSITADFDFVQIVPLLALFMPIIAR